MRPEEKLQKSKEKLEALSGETLSLARRLGEMELIVFNLSRENHLLKQGLSLLNDKLDAIVNVQKESLTLTDENINGAMVKIKENSLKEKVEEMLSRNMIEKSESIELDSFVVGRELDKEGVVENPRIQFLISSLSDYFKEKLLGKKAGDLITDEDKLDLEIVEVYKVVADSQLKIDPQNELSSDQSETIEQQA